ncbi:MAG: two-component regulator propeller domain-containing protein [Bacteroidia bacterium]
MKSFRLKFSSLLMILIASSRSLLAQPEDVHFEVIPTEQGLSNKSIPAIIEDKQGFLWFATQDGLNKYNGYEFKVYQNDPSDTTTISNNNIFCLVQDRDGFLWMGTENGGLNRFDPKTEKFTRYQHDENKASSICSNNIYSVFQAKDGNLWIGSMEEGIDVMDPKNGKILNRLSHRAGKENTLSSGAIWSIFQDNKGIFWISTWGSGLDRYDQSSGKFTHFRHDPKNPNSISYDIVGPVYEDKQGRLWIATWGGGLNLLNRKTETFRNFQNSKDNPKTIGSNLIWPITEDWEGNLWIGTYGSGVNRFDPRTEHFHRFAHDPDVPGSLNHNDVWSLHLDRSNILWVGTEGGGISKYVNIRKEVDVFAYDPGNPLSLGHNSVRAVHEDKDGIIWIGTWDGGLDKYDEENEKIQNFKNDENSGGSTGLNKIKCITSSPDGKLWLGTYRGGLCEFNKQSATFTNYTHNPTDPQTISDNYVYSILIDKQSIFWVGTLNGLNIFDPETKKFQRIRNDPSNEHSLSNNTINSIYQTRDNNLWIGTDYGLNKYDYVKKSFTRFIHEPQDPHSLSHSTVYTVYEDKSGILWVGTRNGLNKYNPANHTFEHFDIKDGLPNSIIMSIQEDDKGQLLLGTKNGISRFNYSTRTFINYDLSDGIQGRQFFPNSSCKAKDGKLYFGGTEGLNSFYPDRIQNNPYLPPVVISSIRKSGEEIHFGKLIEDVNELVLAYHENSLSFDFVGLSYANPDENQYAYKLEGLDEDWKYSGTIRTAVYTNLHPGTYTFRVKASNDDGLWNNKGASIRFVITPPFWKTIWFYCLCILLTLLLIFAYIKNRERSLLKEKKILEDRVTERTAEVTLQKEMLETQNKEIHDSIHYAKRIQEAILPAQEDVVHAFPDSFILFKPRDIVSGDFYWFSEKNGIAIVTAADCTGHGVPGAFMSMIGNTLLNQIVNEKGVTKPDEILMQLRENIMKSLKQTGAEGENKDGMDIALCSFDLNTHELLFAGANNPLYVVSKGELIEIKGDKQPIGVYLGEPKPFTCQRMQLQKGDCVYIASDGYADQFGGSHGKKFKYKQMKDLLLALNQKQMTEQRKTLNEEIEKWRGTLEQVDDILVIGFRV